MCVATPNDPKLSDGGGWRGPCMVGGKVAAEARAVTAVAVRCSAWLGPWLTVLEYLKAIVSCELALVVVSHGVSKLKNPIVALTSFGSYEHSFWI